MGKIKLIFDKKERTPSGVVSTDEVTEMDLLIVGSASRDPKSPSTLSTWAARSVGSVDSAVISPLA